MTPPPDPFDLDRFVQAQAQVYAGALAELRRGRKTSHWMWFVFPQLSGLGASAMARRYAIGSLAEARAYLTHPLLGARLQACARALTELKGRSALEVFGSPDDLKLRSSLTLFEAADPDMAVFAQALEALCHNRRDELTLKKLDRPPTA